MTSQYTMSHAIQTIPMYWYFCGIVAKLFLNFQQQWEELGWRYITKESTKVYVQYKVILRWEYKSDIKVISIPSIIQTKAWRQKHQPTTHLKWQFVMFNDNDNAIYRILRTFNKQTHKLLRLSNDRMLVFQFSYISELLHSVTEYKDQSIQTSNC